MDAVADEGGVASTDSSDSWIGPGAVRKKDDAWEKARAGIGRLGSGVGAGREVALCARGSCNFNWAILCAGASADFGKAS